MNSKLLQLEHESGRRHVPCAIIEYMHIAAWMDGWMDGLNYVRTMLYCYFILIVNGKVPTTIPCDDARLEFSNREVEV